MRAPFSTAIAIAVGLVVLLGYFLPIDSLRGVLVNWAVTLAGLAALVAILNLVGVHWRKLRTPKHPDLYSLVFLLAFLATFFVVAYLGPSDPQVQTIVTNIQIPVEATLLGIVAIILTLAALRLFSRRQGLMAWVFLVSVVFFLLLGSGILGFGSGLLPAGMVQFFQALPIAGSRGILLGMALGSLTAGLRILMGTDRPYSG
ncbi:MAG TPA: hypothetical protein VIO61_04995 [Anaerolineaceae bacterium]